jgi:hypothetical protein
MYAYRPIYKIWNFAGVITIIEKLEPTVFG